MNSSQFKYIAFNKPYGVLSQFTGEADDRTLSDFDLPIEVYAAGRLDKDSEGLLILTIDGVFNQKLTNPRSEKEKTYWIQVEGIPSKESLTQLQEGVSIQKKKTLPAKAKVIAPNVQERTPPIRERKNIPTAWVELKIKEGRNRQVRRMSAAVGHPTLRLIRVQVGNLKLNDLLEGQWKYITAKDIL
jgi:23S rRNA pseudouridine2457 synthase